jgi:hypothetical protein
MRGRGASNFASLLSVGPNSGLLFEQICHIFVVGCGMTTYKLALRLLLAIAVIQSCSLGFAQAFTKVQVADRIRKVEDGVDEFRNWAERRSNDVKNGAQTAQASGRTRKSGRTATEAQKDTAKHTKDDLEDGLSDLNRSTNRLRRKFDPTDAWIETKAQMEQVMDDGRKINQVMVRGNYGSQAERYWAALRNNINDLARCYGITPMGA